MRNQGEGNFDYDSFKVMYDGDPKIQQLVTNFDQDKIEFKQSEVDDVNVAGKPGPEGVVRNGHSARMGSRLMLVLRSFPSETMISVPYLLSHHPHSRVYKLSGPEQKQGIY